jgi:2-polyprenylphenol 6-hydroxylase
MSSSSHSLQFDIAIIGGGMVGTSLASMLAASQPQWRIALIETQPFAAADAIAYQPSFDARSTALSYGSAELLRELGLWQTLQQHITAITQVHVSDKGHLLGGVIDAAERQLDAVGYVVENAWLGKTLLSHVQRQSNIHCFAPATVSELQPRANGALLKVQLGDESLQINTRLAIIAEGGDSKLRSQLGIDTQVRDYAQTAIITNVEFSEAHQGIAYERFTPEGPIALLPLGEKSSAQQAALVWTLPHADAAHISALSDAEFLQVLQQRFGFRQGRFTRTAKRHAYPLQLVLATEQVRAHSVLMGNAAHFLHPVAGQGFNLALRDCACLVETLITAQGPLGNLTSLQAYVAQQALDQQLTIGFSDRLVRIFSSAQLPLIALRHLGLLSLESLDVVKDQLVAQTMGTAGRQHRWLSAVHSSSTTTDDAANVLQDVNIPQQARELSDESNTQYDVIIVGAGLVGATLACDLAQLDIARPLRIAVIEAAAQLPHYSGSDFDPRVVALTAKSQQLLARIGCWDAILQARACAYQQMKVWDGEGTASIEFDAAEVRQPQLGHIVENSVAVQALRERMAQLSQITLIQPAALVALKQPESSRPWVQIELSNGQLLQSPLLIAADGANSKVCELAAFATRTWDYQQTAIVTTVRTEQPHEFTAWQRFMHTGPLAFLPLQEQGDAHNCSIVWSADSALAASLMQLNDSDFCARLGSAFEHRLGQIEACAQRFAIPLRQRHAQNYIQPGIALVGDAAHNIHPLAGQGVNLGLLDAQALSAEIARALNRGLSLSDYSLLRRYQRARLAGNLAMMSAMESFKHLFASRSLTVNWLRNTGMRQLNSVAAAKKILIKAALGSV